jgi:crotonobetainyl-CoA:carnitine CoA-transferase CaiB-like acyl-CoA transferase
MARTENSADLRQLITDRFMVRTQVEWASPLDEGRRICAPVQTLDEIIGDPQVIANEFTTTMEPPEDGEFQLVTVPMKFHRTPTEVAALAAELGQHTETVLLDLGCSWDDITRLKDRGAII